MLENQQLRLVQGLQELYRRMRTGEGWPGAPLQEMNGAPPTHDILERLGTFKKEDHADSAHFEEDLAALQSRLLASGANSRQPEMSFDTISEADLSPMFELAVHCRPAFINPYASQFSLTPPKGSPHPSIVKTSSPLKTYRNTSASHFTQQSQWRKGPLELEGMEYNMTRDSPYFDANMQI